MIDKVEKDKPDEVIDWTKLMLSKMKAINQ